MSAINFFQKIYMSVITEVIFLCSRFIYHAESKVVCIYFEKKIITTCMLYNDISLFLVIYKLEELK